MAWISRVPDAALLRAAEACDALIQREGAAAFDARPLLGALFAVKDNIDVAGLPTTAGCPSFASGPAAQNAAVVQGLVDADAVPVGKTNLDQFATGLVGTRSPCGAVRNPFDSTRVSGGSSSGSAHAASTGRVPFALGTDTAGSERVPAYFCNSQRPETDARLVLVARRGAGLPAHRRAAAARVLRRCAFRAGLRRGLECAEGDGLRSRRRALRAARARRQPALRRTLGRRTLCSSRRLPGHAAG